MKIEHSRNVRNAELNGLGDLNILVGPNNCGKTNILNFISSMEDLSTLQGATLNYLCPKCKQFAENHLGVDGIILPLQSDDFYRERNAKKMTISIRFTLNEAQINSLVPTVIERQRQKVDINKISCPHVNDSITMESDEYGTLRNKHLSVFIDGAIIDEIKRSILFCPDMRLQDYKGKGFEEYIREKGLRTAQKKQWIDFLKKHVDSSIDDERAERLIRKVENKDFETAIAEQGSGVRSMACIAADILFSDALIVLIDEPELGLNPMGKQEFFKFLLEQSTRRQIFVATQDPTFVNPILWKNENVSIYLYSIQDDKFVKINLSESNRDPNLFAGYLPHTMSLKDVHMYVEGSSDAYIFQILLERHLKQRFQNNWWEFFNRIGIYHLGGDFWMHLLYTVPKHPYKCIVILDGDKRAEAKKVCEKYEQSRNLTTTFKFCDELDDLKAYFKGDRQGKTSGLSHPVYCLKKPCIEMYLDSKLDCQNLPQHYNKKDHGPRKAEDCEICAEIKRLFDIILGKP